MQNCHAFFLFLTAFFGLKFFQSFLFIAWILLITHLIVNVPNSAAETWPKHTVVKKKRCPQSINFQDFKSCIWLIVLYVPLHAELRRSMTWHKSTARANCSVCFCIHLAVLWFHKSITVRRATSDVCVSYQNTFFILARAQKS